MAIDPDMEPIIADLQKQIDDLKAAQAGSELFQARDNFETALFAAMQGMTDAEQITYLESLTAYIGGA